MAQNGGSPPPLSPQTVEPPVSAVSSDLPIVTLEQALALPGRAALAAYARHLDPERAAWLRLLHMDRRYTRAEGATLFTEDARSVLDFTAGGAGLVLGHQPAEVLAAVERARSEPVLLGAGYSALGGVLAENLARLLPGALGVAGFCTSSAEAVDLGLRTARAATRRPRLLSCEGAFHGVDFAALSVSSTRALRAAVGPVLEPCERVAPGDLPALERALRGRDVAAFLVEPIQCEQGALVLSVDWLVEARALCRRHGTLLVLDETRVGLARSGRLFALEHAGIEPDVLLLGESLTAGTLPFGASVTSEAVWRQAFGTRGLEPLAGAAGGPHAAACAAALKTLEILLRDGLALRAQELGRHARERLAATLGRHALLDGVRGEGLLLGVALAPPAMPGAQLEENLGAMVASRLLNDHGVLVAPGLLAPQVLRFEPPLTVERAALDRAVEAFDGVLRGGLAGLMMALGQLWVGRSLHGR